MARSPLAALALLFVLPMPGGGQPLPCGPELLVNSDTIGSHGDASVARAADGGFLVVWAGTHGPGDDVDGLSVQARRYDAFGAPVGEQWQVNTYTPGNQSRPRIVPMPNGFVVVWQSDGGIGGDTYLAVEAQRLDAAGAPLGAEFQVNESTPWDQRSPQAASDPSGAFVVVWMSVGSAGDDADDWSIQGRRFDPAGAPLGSQFQVNTYTRGAQRAPAVGSDDTGAFVVTWTNGDYDNVIAARRYDAAGDPPGAEFQVSAAPTIHTYGPAVSVEPEGAFAVVWSEQGEVLASRFDAAGVSLGDAFQVNSFTPNLQYGPALARAADGSLSVVWTSWESAGTDRSFTNVQLRRLDATGVPIAEDAQVNTTTKGRQEAPAIAALGGEDFVVVWGGYDIDDPEFRSRVRGQRFSAICVTTTTTSTSTTTLPAALLRGKTLRLAGKRGTPEALVVRFVSRDAAVSAGRGVGSLDDPMLHGGCARIRAAAWGLDASLDLAAGDWRRVRGGWRYDGDDATVVVKGGRFLRASLTFEGAGPEASDPTPVDVLVQTGEQQLCLAFQSGTADLKRHRIVARNGAAPPACLPPCGE